MAITKEDVFAVADELQGKGVKPTLDLIRQTLGSGSYTTISQAMTAWRTSREVSAKNKEPLPDAVSLALQELGNSLWEKARIAADDRLGAERQRLEDAVVSANAERDDAAQLADALTADVERLKLELTGAQRQLDHATSALNSHKERVAALEARVAEQELRVQERLCEIERLTAQNLELSRALAVVAAGPASSTAGADENAVGSSSSSSV